MITEKEMYRLERELQDWHRRPVVCTNELARPDRLGGAGVFMRVFWSRLARVFSRRPMVSPVQAGTPQTLDLLRAVARGEVSPERANQLLLGSHR